MSKSFPWDSFTISISCGLPAPTPTLGLNIDKCISDSGRHMLWLDRIEQRKDSQTIHFKMCLYMKFEMADLVGLTLFLSNQILCPQNHFFVMPQLAKSNKQLRGREWWGGMLLKVHLYYACHYEHFLGKGGQKIREIQEQSGAYIKVGDRRSYR